MMNVGLVGSSFYDFTRNCYWFDVVGVCVCVYFDADFFNFVVYMIFNILTCFAHAKIWISSYNRLGKNASEADAEEIIEIATKASVADQQMVVQENVHAQIKAFCTFMDAVFLPDEKKVNDVSFELSQQTKILPQHSDLRSANGKFVIHQLTILVKYKFYSNLWNVIVKFYKCCLFTLFICY